MDEFDDLFRRIFSPYLDGEIPSTLRFSPDDFDIIEDDDNFYITLDLRSYGDIAKKDIYLAASEEEIYVEIRTMRKDYTKYITLSEEIKPKILDKTYKNGILDFRVEKTK